MATITVLTGIQAGRVWQLDSESFAIGRQPSNDLELPEPSISRQHCVIEAQRTGEGTRYLIRDLSSANGVNVNGNAVTESELRPGDQVQLGDCLLRFDDSEPRLILSEDRRIESTIVIGPGLIPASDPGAAASAIPQSDRYGDDLRALLDLSVEMAGLRTVAEIQARFLERLVSRIPADCSAVIPMVAPELERCIRRASQYPEFERGSSRRMALEISWTVIDRVAERLEAVLADEVAGGGGPLANAESILRSGTQAVIAAPAFADAKLVGIIYLASTAAGAFDEYHLRLAVAAASILGPALKRALDVEELEQEKARLLSRTRIRHQIVGVSPAIAKALTDIQRVCPTDATVLVLGETGTGKELAAQAIHDNSARSSRPMIAINCAAFTETLVESELFGHERGAFSGAYGLKRGVFEQAQGGTLFLDEIGELPLSLQAKLLRVLESREIRRVGGEKAIPVDFRLVAATHRDLRDAVKAGSFRADLFYRLNIVSITIPPLRERRQDILPLSEHFLAEFARKTSRHIEGFANASRACLERYAWPGNVRELRNAIERAVITGASPQIEVEDLPDSLTNSPLGDAEVIPYKQAVVEARRTIILAAFRSAQGNHNQAARLLGVHPNNLHRMLNELGLRDQVPTQRG